MVTTQVRIGEIDNRQALTRLAAKARRDGIRLYRDRSGRYFASSTSTPGTLHYLTGYSCDCQGFATHQRCKHHAALMTALGWVEDTRDPEPEPPTAIANTCSECQGTGQTCGTISTGPSSWRYDAITCPDCHGSGIPADTDVREAA
jgi:hypothetical protein